MRKLTRVSGSFDYSHHVVHICLVQFIGNVQKDLSGSKQNITKDNTLRRSAKNSITFLYLGIHVDIVSHCLVFILMNIF